MFTFEERVLIQEINRRLRASFIPVEKVKKIKPMYFDSVCPENVNVINNYVSDVIRLDIKRKKGKDTPVVAKSSEVKFSNKEKLEICSAFMKARNCLKKHEKNMRQAINFENQYRRMNEMVYKIRRGDDCTKISRGLLIFAQNFTKWVYENYKC